jgi:hypothetical protein
MFADVAIEADAPELESGPGKMTGEGDDPMAQVRHKPHFMGHEAQPVRSHPRYLPSMTLGGFPMTRKDRLALYGRIGLILGSFAIIGGVVAEPLVRHMWPARLTVAQR